MIVSSIVQSCLCVCVCVCLRVRACVSLSLPRCLTLPLSLCSVSVYSLMFRANNFTTKATEWSHEVRLLVGSNDSGHQDLTLAQACEHMNACVEVASPPQLVKDCMAMFWMGTVCERLQETIQALDIDRLSDSFFEVISGRLRASIDPLVAEVRALHSLADGSVLLIKMADDGCLAKYSVGLTGNFDMALREVEACGARNLTLRLAFLRDVHSCLRKCACLYVKFRTWATPDDRKPAATHVEALLGIHMELSNVKAFADAKDLFAVDTARRTNGGFRGTTVSQNIVCTPIHEHISACWVLLGVCAGLAQPRGAGVATCNCLRETTRPLLCWPKSLAFVFTLA